MGEVMERKSLSKKIRFEVFKRDLFKCQYCGIEPPNGLLEVDHIIPVSKGGCNSEDNLITSCFDCNRGKSNIELTEITPSINNKYLVLKEKEEQLKQFENLIRNRRRKENKNIIKLEDIFNVFHPDSSWTENFKISIKRQFFTQLTYQEIEESLYIACEKSLSAESCSKYFCGVCWNKIKNRGHYG